MTPEARPSTDRSDWHDDLRKARKDLRQARTFLASLTAAFIIIGAGALAVGLVKGLVWYVGLYAMAGLLGFGTLAVGAWLNPVRTLRAARMILYPAAAGSAAFTAVAAARGLDWREVLVVAIPCGALIANARMIARAEISARVLESPEAAEGYFDEVAS